MVALGNLFFFYFAKIWQNFRKSLKRFLFKLCFITVKSSNKHRFFMFGFVNAEVTGEKEEIECGGVGRRTCLYMDIFLFKK